MQCANISQYTLLEALETFDKIKAEGMKHAKKAVINFVPAMFNFLPNWTYVTSIVNFGSWLSIVIKGFTSKLNISEDCISLLNHQSLSPLGVWSMHHAPTSYWELPETQTTTWTVMIWILTALPSQSNAHQPASSMNCPVSLIGITMRFVPVYLGN